jgi:thiol:disulfide interchange protein DsbA
VHGKKLRLEKVSEISALASANGIDGEKLLSTMKSFSVATKCAQAKQAAAAWRIDGVPTLGVQGRFMTSPSQAGGHEQALQVLDALIVKARKG